MLVKDGGIVTAYDAKSGDRVVSRSGSGSVGQLLCVAGGCEWQCVSSCRSMMER